VAESLNETAGPEVRPAEHTPAPVPAPAKPSRARDLFRNRFALAYLGLAAVLGAAVGLLVVLVSNNTGAVSQARTAKWSDWQPTEGGTVAVRQIASEIGPRYRLPNGQQLVGVVAGPMLLQSADRLIRVSAFLIASGRAGVPAEEVRVEFPGAGVFYQFCGAGPNCVIPGAPDGARGLLLSREALELALYTFHYLPQADHVLAFLPPPPGVPRTDPQFQRVLYLPRTYLAPLLRVPLTSALPPGTVTLKPSDLSPQQLTMINDFTENQVYHWEFQPIPDQSAVVQLSPLEP
jgi:hypothetical protein